MQKKIKHSFDRLIQVWHLKDPKFLNMEPTPWLKEVYIPFILGKKHCDKKDEEGRGNSIPEGLYDIYGNLTNSENRKKLCFVTPFMKMIEDNTLLPFRDCYQNKNGNKMHAGSENIGYDDAPYIFKHNIGKPFTRNNQEVDCSIYKDIEIPTDPSLWGDMIYSIAKIEYPWEIYDGYKYQHLIDKNWEDEITLADYVKSLHTYSFAPFETEHFLTQKANTGIDRLSYEKKKVSHRGIKVPAESKEQAIEILWLYLYSLDLMGYKKGNDTVWSNRDLDLKSLIESESSETMADDFLRLPYNREFYPEDSPEPSLPKDPELAWAVFSEMAAFEFLPMRDRSSVTKATFWDRGLPMTVLKSDAAKGLI